MEKFLQRCADYARKGLVYAYFGSTIFWMMPYVHSPPLGKKEVYVREIPVHVLMEKEFKERYGSSLGKIMGSVSEVYSRELRELIDSDVLFVPESQTNWEPDYKAPVEDLMSDVVKRSRDGINLAFIDDPLYSEKMDSAMLVGWVDEIGGRAAVVSSYLNVADHEKRIRNRVIHSLGHIFGAHDRRFDPSSFMYDFQYLPGADQQFDAESKNLIAKSIGERYPNVKKIRVPCTKSN